jgi:hypothetical protein
MWWWKKPGVTLACPWLLDLAVVGWPGSRVEQEYNVRLKQVGLNTPRNVALYLLQDEWKTCVRQTPCDEGDKALIRIHPSLVFASRALWHARGCVWISQHGRILLVIPLKMMRR